MKNYLTEKNNNGNYFLDDMINDFFKPVFYRDNADYMATDVKEHEHSYELEIDMPGYDKKDISVDFEKGYLTVSAKKEQKNTESKYLSRERRSVSRRSYYVGEIDENGITAKYENGVLSVMLPKRAEEKPASKRISVE